jgi:uncharacterized membrane protein
MAFIDRTIEVAADVHDAYEVWTAFTDYPEFMECVETVTVTLDDQLHWVALIEDETCEWDTDMVEEVPDTSVTWRAIDGRETGEVRFEKVEAGVTKVTYQLEYAPAAWEGKADTVRHWMRRRVDKDLENFKKMVEAVA